MSKETSFLLGIVNRAPSITQLEDSGVYVCSASGVQGSSLNVARNDISE